MSSFTTRKEYTRACDDYVTEITKPGVTRAFNKIPEKDILAGQKRTRKELVN